LSASCARALPSVIPFAWFGFAALPVSMGVAILKYRLYEIDRIISRTLAYAVVTGLLIGVYAGLVLLATQVLSAGSQVAVAASTLAAAALFSPLRRRVQRAVDRRFNRARYDADKTVAAFASRLNDAVDLDASAPTGRRGPPGSGAVPRVSVDHQSWPVSSQVLALPLLRNHGRAAS